MKLTSVIALIAIGAIGLVGVERYKDQAANAAAAQITAPGGRAPDSKPAATEVEDRSWIKARGDAPASAGAPAAAPRCDGRTHCSQMRSCEEAKYFIQHCPNTQMDGDRDGVPCEEQWC